ncbi:unnamed protein product [Rodentolepis nana]|uniref:Serine incorporator 5 n=1 Tax=Rodentolepis nana TaxID=102285 RepID=A0A0R3TM25_RODNA|nr:unnamed protein product [Rodentolepis nana]
MGCLISCVACCFCDAAASLCCKCLPSCRNSTSTRLLYGLILFTVLIVSCICLNPSIATFLKKIPYLCSTEQSNICNLITGYGAVYRLCFSLSLFFCFFSIFMIQVKSSADFRAAIHNGFWFFKIIAIIGIMVGAFFIHSYEFLYVWRIFGMIGSLCFIIVQLTLIVDLAYSWNQAWIEGFEESGNRAIICGFIFSTILFYALAFIGIVLFYVYFASAPACRLGKMLVSINLIFCVIFSIISILPKIQEHLPNSGLLQSSIISAYVVFLTWSALVDIPIAECNPTLNLINVTIIDSSKNKVTVETSNLSFNWQTGISITVTLLSIAFACIRNSSSNSLSRLTMDVG